MKSDLEALDPWRWRWLYLAVALFLADQGTKWIVVNELVYGERIQVLPFFAWVRWHNAGAAFSFWLMQGLAALVFRRNRSGFLCLCGARTVAIDAGRTVDGLGLRAYLRRCLG